MPRNQTRVLRGGSWNNNAANARASQRNRNHPDNRNDNVGFRLVSSAHIAASARFAGTADHGLRYATAGL
ncbi:SUMF1/EgtB/PvdO family nonheme iron enzyme [Candidatus Accumulibacter phosphatis]|uniref:SUMF1/EgtB/PvdO family nonheme iron enzyme n=1 Tax=Candidatus Accumulibacter phosphatis TaxID=327160 RepID=UPI00235B6A31|nr:MULTISPECIES: SUMF1/EgtB/PvdO family nonheme iron enzyme [Candidatus Accumulibacter]